MGTYKFLNSEHLASVFDRETIRLCTFKHYRGCETSGGIGDPNEGVSTIELPHYVDGPDHVENERIRSRIPGIRLVNQFRGVYTDIRSITNFDGYLYCASRGDLLRLTPQMCHQGEEQYDACYSIVSLNYFAQHLYEFGVIEGGGLFKDVVLGPQVGDVRYTGTVQDVRVKRPDPPSPFVKDKILYDRQCETRAYFEARKKNELQDVIFVKAPGINRFVGEQFRNLLPSAAAAQSDRV